MNKLFVKYLPVNGKINVGDIVRNNLDGLVGKTIRDISQPEIDDNEYSKLEPFICSNDIQIGDKVFLENDYNYIATVINKINNSSRDIVLDKMPKDRENGTLDSREMLKVIGKISPYAKWVKDGDELDKSEIKALYTKEYYGDNSDWRENREFRNVLEWFQVKGPCGHFH